MIQNVLFFCFFWFPVGFLKGLQLFAFLDCDAFGQPNFGFDGGHDCLDKFSTSNI